MVMAAQYMQPHVMAPNQIMAISNPSVLAQQSLGNACMFMMKEQTPLSKFKTELSSNVPPRRRGRGSSSPVPRAACA